MAEIEQGSPEWFAARLGKVTASRVADVIAKTKTGWGASRTNYAAELVAERLTGASAEKFSNAAMAWGTEKEPDARAAYEFYSDATVDLVGFVSHPTIRDAGASPDGRVGAEGLVEIKCPRPAGHIATLRAGKPPADYLPQMVLQMACTGAQAVDFVSYCSAMPDKARLCIVRIERDDKVVEEMEDKVRAFLADVDAAVKQVLSYSHKEAA